MKKILLLLTLAVVFLSSCKKFLEDYSQDLAYVSSVQDLNELLIGGAYIGNTGASFSFVNVMDDDVESYMNANATLSYAGYHYWKKSPSSMEDVPYADAAWAAIYKSVAVVNAVLYDAEKFKSEPGYAKVKGEAYFLRASNYFHLVNFYAKPYVKATAESDLGVPLKLTEYVEDKHFKRNTVAEVYSSIVADLKNAITMLAGVKQPSVYRANEMAARALLSEVYLYMGEWQLAAEQCDVVIKSGGYSLLDLNNYPTTNSFTGTASSEIIFSEGSNMIFSLMNPANTDAYQWINTYVPSAELLSLYKPDDLRFDFSFIYAVETPRYVVQKLKYNDTKIVSDFAAIRLPEVYLNMAEAMAMLDRPADAISILKTLREKRFKNAAAGDINLSGEALVNFIRTERRMELCFEGHRWNDLRRYAVSPKYPYSKEIVHQFYEYDVSGVVRNTGYYKLKTYAEDSKAYVLPIPNDVVLFNGGELIDNARDKRDKIN